MIERDVHATLSSLALLVESTKGAEPLALLHSYAAVRTLCANLFDPTATAAAAAIREKALVQQEETQDLMAR